MHRHTHTHRDKHILHVRMFDTYFCIGEDAYVYWRYTFHTPFDSILKEITLAYI